MRNLFKTVFVLFFVAGAATLFMVGCKKNDGVHIVDPQPIPPKHQIVMVPFDAMTNDTLAGFNLKIVTNKGTNNYISAGKKYIIDNVEPTTYTITISKVGYVDVTRSYDIAIRNVEEDMIVCKRMVMNRLSNPVEIPLSSEGTLLNSLQFNVVGYGLNTVGNTSKYCEAKLSFEEGTLFKVNDINQTNLQIVATNIYNEVYVTITETPTYGHSPDVMFNHSQKEINFQPEGLTFSKPVKMKLYIGDLREQNQELFTQRKKGMILVNTDKTGKQEKLKPLGESINGDTIYFDITHFGTWELKNEFFSARKINEFWSASETSDTSKCGGELNVRLSKEVRIKNSFQVAGNASILPFLLTRMYKDIVFETSTLFQQPPVPRYKQYATWIVKMEKWEIISTIPNFEFVQVMDLPSDQYILSFGTTYCNN